MLLPVNLRKRVTGIILAGGKNSRFGSDKALAFVGGRSVISRVAEAVSKVCGNILIVGAKMNPIPEFAQARVISDAPNASGPANGLLSGLRECSTEIAFCVACDMPFIDTELSQSLVEFALSGDNGKSYDAVVPEHELGLEPLHSVYSRDCLPVLERLVEMGERRIAPLFPLVKTFYFKVELWRYKNSFLNINTPEDLAYAEWLYKEIANKERQICR